MGGIRNGAVCALAGVVGLLLATAPAWATFPGLNGKIAYDGIGTVNPDGTGEANLTSGEHPAWSSDGTKIAFTTNRDGNYEIYVINADGSGLTRLTSNAAADIDPAWSPDGTKVVFATNRDELDPAGRCFGLTSPGCNFEIYVMNVDGTAQTRMTTSPLVDREPNWSPDGATIAFESDRDDPNVPSCTPCNFDIYVMEADGNAQTRLTTGSVLDIEPNWLPDGSRIAFSSDGDIYVMNADGGAPTRITDNDTVTSHFSDLDPAWSPDDTKLAVTGRQCGPTPSSGCVDAVYTLNTDGTERHALVLSGGPDWQPRFGNAPPDCSRVTATPSVLHPPSHELRLVSLAGATDPDGDAVSISIDGVTQDEPPFGPGKSTPDASPGRTPNEVFVRAERSAQGDGRMYRISFTASDGLGATCAGTVSVAVPKNPSLPAIDSAPPSYDSFGS